MGICFGMPFALGALPEFLSAVDFGGRFALGGETIVYFGNPDADEIAKI